MTNNNLRIFTGAVAIITGGASGIGRALGEALAHRGAEVILADRQAEIAEQAAARIRATGGKVTAADLDVTDFFATKRLVQETVSRCGRLDYMFNNAGIVVIGPAQLYQLEDWCRVIDVNLQGVINGVHAAYSVMHEQGFGHIINTASMSGLLPSPSFVSYATSKHAIVGLSNSLQPEAAAAGVRVSVLCPGVVLTSMLEDGGKYGKNLQPIPREELQKHIASLRPMAPEKFAAKVLRAVARNRAVIIVPGWWRIFWWLNRCSPSFWLYLQRKLFEASQRNLAKLAHDTAKGQSSA